MPIVQRVLVKARRAGGVGAALSSVKPVQAYGVKFRLESTGAEAAGAGVAAAAGLSGSGWVSAVPQEENGDLRGWDWAHAVSSEMDNAFAEPDQVQAWVFEKRQTPPRTLAARVRDVEDEQSADWGAVGGSFAWHLEKTGLREARRVVGSLAANITIAHLDTGYDALHAALPRGLDKARAANFTGDGRPFNDATDPDTSGNRGHGTGTLGILAGGRLTRTPPRWGGPWDDDLGGSPESRVIPVRIASSVVHLYTSAMTDGIDHARRCGADVVSISMGGLPSKRWAEAVNAAYDAGVVIVAAAGNRIGKSPPRSMVWPGRFRRVIAACGVNFNGKPYYRWDNFTRMQGCWGPDRAMDTAMSAYTPNISWAEIGSRDLIDHDGAGTSSATPQVAAAAALWLAQHGAGLSGWQRVEAVRRVLFSTAAGRRATPDEKLGWGILRALEAVRTPPDLRGLVKEAEDSVVLGLPKVLIGLAKDLPRSEMLTLEAAQLIASTPGLEELAEKEGRGSQAGRALAGEIAASPLASAELRKAFAKKAGRGKPSALLRTEPPKRKSSGGGKGGSTPRPSGKPVVKKGAKKAATKKGRRGSKG